MASYFHGSIELQPHGMQTLYLMNPSINSYLMNSTPNSLDPAQRLDGIPVQPAGQPHDPSRPSPNIHYSNLWTHRGLSLSVTMGSPTAMINSRYLRLAQQLLDEVVSVWDGVGDAARNGLDGRIQMKPSGGDCLDGENGKPSVELTAVEKQELQIKKAKLVNMLDEVAQRYKQYRQQMQIVVSTFEAAAGIGSAKAYTALALQTISRQFRCLRDAITDQIRTTARSLGEEEEFTERGSRLRFIDQQVRQQRALQQLGMIQHNAWRPQRGLPERAVSVLRAWLFEHFLHPYPRDSDKQMLAKQTGLTRSQVSNWFINARVRLWKPMVEEMYKEEMKEQEQSNGEERTSDAVDASDESSSKSAPAYPQPYAHANYGELKKARRDEPVSIEHESHGFGFDEYPVGGIERFGIEQFAPGFSAGNNVSLTLGLTQYGNLSLPGAQPSYLASNGIEINGGYGNMSMESRKRFAAQLLPDFVA